MDARTEVEVGASYHVEADIFLGELRPEDVMVESYCGRLDPYNEYLDSFSCVMKPSGKAVDHVVKYACDVQFEEGGHFGINLRLTPNHPNPESRHAMGLVIWGK